MGYLVCDECNGFYELQPRESPDDFDLTCSCGGELKFHNSLDNNDNGDIEAGIESIEVDKSYAEQQSSQYDIIIIIGAVLGLIGLVGFF